MAKVTRQDAAQAVKPSGTGVAKATSMKNPERAKLRQSSLGVLRVIDVPEVFGAADPAERIANETSSRNARELASQNTRQIRENDARNFFQLRENVLAVSLAGGSGPTYISSCRRRGKPTRRPSGPKGSQGPRPARVTGGSDGSLPERVAGAPKGTIRADLRVSSGPSGLVSPRASARDGTAGRLARDDRARKERVPRNSKPCEQGTPRGGLTAFSGFPASWGAAPWEGMGRNRGV